MEVTKLTNEELKNEIERLETIFEKCKKKIGELYETMTKASEQYQTLNNELKKRNIK